MKAKHRVLVVPSQLRRDRAVNNRQPTPYADTTLVILLDDAFWAAYVEAHRAEQQREREVA